MASPSRKKIVLYTDGSCLGNPGPGGWGAVLLYQTHRKEISGGEPHTTNNRMELTAAIEGLKLLKEPCEVELYTDSAYLKNGMTQWIHGWKKKGLLSAPQSRIANCDLWNALDHVATNHKVNWHWVKAHNGTEENERADVLARSAAEALR